MTIYVHATEPQRRTGRTTHLIASALLHALNHPEQRVYFVVHNVAMREYAGRLASSLITPLPSNFDIVRSTVAKAYRLGAIDREYCVYDHFQGGE